MEPGAVSPFVNFWNPHRTTDSPAEHVLAERSRSRASCVGKRITRVKEIVAKELPGRPVEIIPAGLRYNVNYASKDAAILGLIVVGLHLELLNRVDYGQNGVAAAEEEFIDDAVQKKHV